MLNEGKNHESPNDHAYDAFLPIVSSTTGTAMLLPIPKVKIILKTGDLKILKHEESHREYYECFSKFDVRKL